MAQAYHDADLVLCRSGATTVAELCLCGCPSILIPFPYAIDNHQSANAHVLAKAGAAIVMEQSEMNSQKVFDLILSLVRDREKLKKMSQSALACANPEAAKNNFNSN